jgi:ABC-type lipoprotein export system ATPase subunit
VTPAITARPVLRMEAVARAFPSPQGRVDALRRVDLAVHPGDFVAITGPSGSGKSTLLHLAALLDAPSGGRVVFEGRDTSGLEEKDLCEIRKSKIGMVFQKFCLLPHRSALENVAFRFRYTGAPAAAARELAAQALAEVGLESVQHREVRVMSGGEMQRVAIARAVALRPSLLVADEPTGNLDAASARGVMEAFRLLNGRGITVLMATHNRSLLEYCSRHLECRDGELADGKGAYAGADA